MSTQIQSQELEKYFVAGLLKYPDVFQMSIVQIQPNYFQTQAYQIIFNAIAEKIKLNQAFDALIIKQSVYDQYPEIVWNEWFYGISQCQVSASKVEDCIALLEEMHQHKILNEIAAELTASNHTFADRIDQALLALVQLKQRNASQSTSFFSGLLLSQLDAIVQGEKKHLLSSGFAGLDQLMGGGFEAGQLTVLGARTGMGKTRLLLSMFKDLIRKQGKKVLFLSYGMTAPRFLKAYLFGVPLESSVDFEMPSENELHQEIAELNRLENEGLFQFCHLLESNEKYLLTGILKQVIASPVDMVIIDSIQYLQQPDANTASTREKYIGNVLKELKRLAHIYNFSLLVGSEISRNAEKRGYANRPILSDLKDSGWIEELADQVVFLYRPSYYHLCEWEDGTNAQNQAELIVAKNNRFQTGTVRVSYDVFGRFSAFNSVKRAIPENRLNEL